MKKRTIWERLMHIVEAGTMPTALGGHGSPVPAFQSSMGIRGDDPRGKLYASAKKLATVVAGDKTKLVSQNKEFMDALAGVAKEVQQSKEALDLNPTFVKNALRRYSGAHEAALRGNTSVAYSDARALVIIAKSMCEPPIEK
jgi:hypothetical protein